MQTLRLYIYPPAALVAPLLYRLSKLFVPRLGVYVSSEVSDSNLPVGHLVKGSTKPF